MSGDRSFEKDRALARAQRERERLDAVWRKVHQQRRDTANAGGSNWPGASATLFAQCRQVAVVGSTLCTWHGNVPAGLAAHPGEDKPAGRLPHLKVPAWLHLLLDAEAAA
jgi:hypothetical protein